MALPLHSRYVFTDCFQLGKVPGNEWLQQGMVSPELSSSLEGILGIVGHCMDLDAQKFSLATTPDRGDLA